MSFTLQPLQVKDQLKAQQCLSTTFLGAKTPLATWAFAPHYIWKEIIKYTWAEIDSWWCLFAEYADHLFMPLPPMGPRTGRGKSPAVTFPEIIAQAMNFMNTRNACSPHSRIENIPEEMKDHIQSWGYSLTLRDSDYLYRTSDLIQLKATGYKSQRAAYNRFSRSHRIRMAPYRIQDRDGCLALYYRWINQKEEIAIPQVALHTEIDRLKLQEAAHAHRVILQEYHELGLTGRVVWVDGSIKAYAFGYPRSHDVFCLLIEVADRSISGLAQYLFREFCRNVQHYAFINTMTDSGLPNIARIKHAYRPIQLVHNYVAQQ